jgi:hypothetical protein
VAGMELHPLPGDCSRVRATASYFRAGRPPAGLADPLAAARAGNQALDPPAEKGRRPTLSVPGYRHHSRPPSLHDSACRTNPNVSRIARLNFMRAGFSSGLRWSWRYGAAARAAPSLESRHVRRPSLCATGWIMHDHRCRKRTDLPQLVLFVASRERERAQCLGVMGFTEPPSVLSGPGAVHWSAAAGGDCLSGPFQWCCRECAGSDLRCCLAWCAERGPESPARLAAVGTVRGAPVDVLTGQAGRGWPLRELPASQRGFAAGRSGLRLPLPAIRRWPAA